MSDKSDTGLDDPSDTILNIGNNVMYIKKDPHDHIASVKIEKRGTCLKIGRR